MFRCAPCLLLFGAIGVVCAVVNPNARAATETVLYAFNGNADSNSKSPTAGLVPDKDANLYGTTIADVFKLTPPASGQSAWKETLIYGFNLENDGSPEGTLAIGPLGGLYGVTDGGGIYGYGQVFWLTPPAAGGTTWNRTGLYDFEYQAAPRKQDGGTPVAGVILDADGNLYGTTELGGYGTQTPLGTGYGTIFKLTRTATGVSPWPETILHRFSGTADGMYPVAGLIMDQKGSLYGTTVQGGNTGCYNNGCGVVFRLNPPPAGSTAWTTTVLHRFAYVAGATADGWYPVSGLVADQNGVLYGTTERGGSADLGIAFALTPPAAQQGGWTETILHSFTGGPDGAHPTASLLLSANGVLTGTTVNGGTSDWGTVR